MQVWDALVSTKTTKTKSVCFLAAYEKITADVKNN